VKSNVPTITGPKEVVEYPVKEWFEAMVISKYKEILRPITEYKL
jgi:hypothetical protein